jgi:hypothetical protein
LRARTAPHASSEARRVAAGGQRVVQRATNVEHASARVAPGRQATSAAHRWSTPQVRDEPFGLVEFGLGAVGEVLRAQYLGRAIGNGTRWLTGLVLVVTAVLGGLRILRLDRRRWSRDRHRRNGRQSAARKDRRALSEERPEGLGVERRVLFAATETGLTRPKDVFGSVGPDERQCLGEVDGRTRRRVEPGGAQRARESGRERSQISRSRYAHVPYFILNPRASSSSGAMSTKEWS